MFRLAPPLQVTLADYRFPSQVFVPSFLFGRDNLSIYFRGDGQPSYILKGGTDNLSTYFRGGRTTLVYTLGGTDNLNIHFRGDRQP